MLGLVAPPFFYVPPSGAPIVAGTNVYGGGSSSSHNVNLPASISAGDLLLLFITLGGNDTISSAPSDFSLLQNVASGSTASDRRLFTYWKTATGSEGSTVAVGLGSSQSLSANSYRITGWSGTPEMPTGASGTSANPDPPASTPSWGGGSTLWVAAFGGRAASVSAFPSGYSGGISELGGSNRVTGSAYIRTSATTENPGTFTMNASDTWAAGTVAVQPA